MTKDVTIIRAVFTLVMVLILVLVMLTYKDYEKEIDKQKEEIKQLKKDKQWLMKQILELEDKDCSWLENYYYNDISGKDSWVIIDGAYYQYKRELTPEERFGDAWEE